MECKLSSAVFLALKEAISEEKKSPILHSGSQQAKEV